MPSPFPGMDPYLEGHEWGTFHIEFSVEIRRRLSPKVGPKYHVLTMRRFITEEPESVAVTKRDIYPDTAVVKETTPVWEAAPPMPVKAATIIPAEIPHYVVEIRAAGDNELVTSIEVLSPANKRGKGYLEYLDKRERILRSHVHLIEIDWLRDGQRVPMQEPLPDAPYYVYLSRAENRPILDVWPVQFTSKLPTIPVPLLADDEDVSLDLQAAFNAVYDSVGYQTLLDYSQLPTIPLAGETAILAATLLQNAGFIGEQESK
jgi:hypothetical protein